MLAKLTKKVLKFQKKVDRPKKNEQKNSFEYIIPSLLKWVRTVRKER